MILRFKTTDNADNPDYMNINFNDKCYNFGKSKKHDYIAVSNKDYYKILNEIEFNCFDYSEDLGTGNPEDMHPFATNPLNKICWDCPHLYDICDGKEQGFYTACYWKDKPADDLAEYRK